MKNRFYVLSLLLLFFSCTSTYSMLNNNLIKIMGNDNNCITIPQERIKISSFVREQISGLEYLQKEISNPKNEQEQLSSNSNTDFIHIQNMNTPLLDLIFNKIVPILIEKSPQKSKNIAEFLQNISNYSEIFSCKKNKGTKKLLFGFFTSISNYLTPQKNKNYLTLIALYNAIDYLGIEKGLPAIIHEKLKEEIDDTTYKLAHNYLSHPLFVYLKEDYKKNAHVEFTTKNNTIVRIPLKLAKKSIIVHNLFKANSVKSPFFISNDIKYRYKTCISTPQLYDDIVTLFFEKFVPFLDNKKELKDQIRIYMHGGNAFAIDNTADILFPDQKTLRYLIGHNPL